MAHYNATTRTNYFSVKDEVRFREIMRLVEAEEDVEVFEQVEEGVQKFGFGCCGIIYGIFKENTGIFDMDELFLALQEVLCEGDAVIIMETGYEKLRYIVGSCIVITYTDIQVIDMQNQALEAARDMLSNPDFCTQMDY